MRIDLDDDEVWAVIYFNRDMAEQARDSCEWEEAREREIRAKQLAALLSVVPLPAKAKA
jgi:hypothetical protein